MDIPDPIYRRLKAKAANEGRSVKSLVLEAVQRDLNGGPPRQRRQVKLPIIHSKRPGTLKIDNARIYEILFS